MAKSKKRNRSESIQVDFTGVEASSRTVEDGTYSAKITKCEVRDSESSDSQLLNFVWEISLKKGMKAIVYDNASLQPQALWRLRLLLESLGETIPEGVMDIDPDDLIGREAKVEITNEKYDGKNRPRITGFIPSDAEESEEEESEEETEEEEEKPTKKSSKKKVEEEEEDEDEDEEDEDEEEDEKPSKKKSSSKLKVGQKVWFKDDDGKKIKGVITSLDDDTAQIEDASKEEWEVETSELNVA